MKLLPLIMTVSSMTLATAGAVGSRYFIQPTTLSGEIIAGAFAAGWGVLCGVVGVGIIWRLAMKGRR